METLLNTERLERLSQKEIVRFYTCLMNEQSLNPQKFKDIHYDIVSVNVNDKDLMTNVEIKLKSLSGTRSFIYIDYHAKNYSCSNISLSPIEL